MDLLGFLFGMGAQVPIKSTTQATIQGPLSLSDLKPGAVLHAQGHTWYPAPGEECSVETAYYATAEEANERLREIVAGMGYTKPRWWEWWRWSERKNVALE